jgi:hypothetical protein
MINIKSVITQNNQLFLSNDLNNEMVLMNLDNGSYIGLNEISTQIWKILDKPSEVAELISILTQKYNVDHETCEQQTIVFLEKMFEQNMIIVS